MKAIVTKIYGSVYRFIRLFNVTKVLHVGD